MFKIKLHTTEQNSAKLLSEYYPKHPTIIKGIFLPLEFSEKKDDPDILVERMKWVAGPELDLPVNHCAIENKFDDYTPSLNSGHLLKQLTEMRAKYSYDCFPAYPRIPLYLVVVNRLVETWIMVEDEKGELLRVKSFGPLISQVDLVRGFKMCQRLNIRFEYCSHKGLYAAKIIKLIRKPPKGIVDLGQKFIVKSTGSIFNQQLQIQPGITITIADNIEENWTSWYQFSNFIRIWLKNGAKKDTVFYHNLKICFTSETGRVMESNLTKFLQEVQKIV